MLQLTRLLPLVTASSKPVAQKIAVSLLLVMAMQTNSKAARPSDADRNDLTVTVESALPVKDRPCQLALEVNGSSPVIELQEADVSFFIEQPAIKTRTVRLPGIYDAVKSRISVLWIPKHTGLYRIQAKITGEDRHGKHVRFKTPSTNIYVTSRPLHFNYWQAKDEQRFVTSVMDNSDSNTSAIRWTQRGVLPLGYKSGQWHWAHGFDSVEKMTGLWTAIPEKRTGIVIDEFGGGDDVDQQLGEALLLTRKQHPNIFIAPYCLSVSGKQMIAGYRASDLILVETYTSDWRWDGTIVGRWQTAVDAGLKDKSIAVLGLGSNWIGTERELRRVFQMIRATCPEMCGVGFFPDVPPRLIPAVDSAIEDFFLRPVVEVQINNEQFTLRNIGESTAFNTELIFRDRNGTRIAPNKVVASLTPWSEYRDRLPLGTSKVDIKPAPERYTVLDYQPPLKSEQLDVKASLDSRRFKNEMLNGDVSNLEIVAEQMAITRDKNNNVSNASTSIHDTNGKAFAMTFDLSPKRCYFYGHNSVSLVGNGELTLTWARQDHDAGIQVNQSRPALVFKGADGYVVREVSTIGFRENETYHVMLSYDGSESVRVIITSSKDKEEVLWDSQRLPAMGGFSCNKLRFDVNAYPRSTVTIDNNSSNILLRGGGGESDSPYWLESTVSNFKIFH